jgi:putative isomerase
MAGERMKNYGEMLRQYILESVDKTLKEPNDRLKHPFVDPGSVYGGNLWDWDSFWAVYAILNLVESPSSDHRYVQYAKGNIYNFLDYQLEDGYIPMMITRDKYEEPYLIMKHKEGAVLNMHKPFLCQQIVLISDFCNDYAWISSLYAKLQKYFDCYDHYYYHNRTGLYVWADDVMIGMDNDPATFGRPRFSTANIYLNSFMIAEFKAMSILSEKLGRAEQSEHYLRKAEELGRAIHEECWDRRDKFFYSVDVDIETRAYDWFHKGLGVFWKSLPIKIRVWSGFIPLYSGIATPEQAAYLVREHFSDANTFRSMFGVRTLAQDEKMYNCSATNNPSNWLGPIWIVSNYIVFRGLMNYGYVKEAEELCQKTVELLGRDLESTGMLHEYYHPETGEPVMNGGFLNWNLLVLNMIDEVKGKAPMLRMQ